MTDPYTEAEMRADIREWSHASAVQRGEAFDRLLGAVVTQALSGDAFLALVLRDLRAARNKQRRINGACSWCGEPMAVPVRPQGGGRTKLYCSAAHKQAARRADLRSTPDPR